MNWLFTPANERTVAYLALLYLFLALAVSPIAGRFKLWRARRAVRRTKKLLAQAPARPWRHSPQLAAVLAYVLRRCSVSTRIRVLNLVWDLAVYPDLKLERELNETAKLAAFHVPFPGRERTVEIPVVRAPQRPLVPPVPADWDRSKH